MTTLLSLVGMTGSSMAVATLFLYSAELFPTVVRNSGLGIANLCARIGGIIAPYIPDLVLSLYMFLTLILVLLYLPRCQLCVRCKIYNDYVKYFIQMDVYSIRECRPFHHKGV